ncbi:MAG TPA: phenylalanine--tRNA ligase subunit alpha [Nitrososphaerales archaeon]|nr:phenylalanine--tRNA ligase subunit alpha [Nitrososphaerales archaeon]
MSSSLHPIERKVLSALGTGTLGFESLVKGSGLHPDQVRRSIEWLSSKGLVKVSESVHGRLAVEVRTPPELVLFDLVSKSRKPPTLQAAREAFSSGEEFSAALGRARSSRWITIDGSVSPAVVKVADSEAPSRLRSMLGSIASGADEAALDGEQRRMVTDLLKRGILTRVEQRSVSVSATAAGRKSLGAPIEADQLDRLSPDVLSTGSWRGKTLRPIDVEAKAPVFYPGRRHPVRDFIREVREVYISMGFTELEGGSVHPAFWNFDALFIPQDHPGREMQDTFYLEGLSDAGLQRKGVVARVASTHENGWKTGSSGWGYTWRIEEARRLVLRTHNTVLTVRALSESREKETRVFAVSKVYRNENLDYKHLAEFYQMDGIIVGEGLNVRHLMGFLTEFYKKLGMKEVKLWPTYFPYTEPSLEVVGYSQVAKAWIELSGSGVFRPEVTEPLGVRVPVLAWGPGIERLMLMRFGLDDMRDLYGVDLSWLRNRVEYASRKS